MVQKGCLRMPRGSPYHERASHRSDAAPYAARLEVLSCSEPWVMHSWQSSGWLLGFIFSGFWAQKPYYIGLLGYLEPQGSGWPLVRTAVGFHSLFRVLGLNVDFVGRVQKSAQYPADRLFILFPSYRPKSQQSAFCAGYLLNIFPRRFA